MEKIDDIEGDHQYSPLGGLYDYDMNFMTGMQRCRTALGSLGYWVRHRLPYSFEQQLLAEQIKQSEEMMLHKIRTDIIT